MFTKGDKSWVKEVFDNAKTSTVNKVIDNDYVDLRVEVHTLIDRVKR